MKQQKRPCIMLIFGGRGCEHDISVASAEYIYSLTDKRLYGILPIYISREGEWLMSGKTCESLSAMCFDIPATLTYRGKLAAGDTLFDIDAAIPVLHGDFGEDGTVQGALENVRIPYVGCDSITGALCSDKVYTKCVARELSIDTARHTVSRSGESASEFSERAEGLGYPIFIKPARLGSSFGASVARNKDELLASVQNAYNFSERVLAEEYIDISAELECAYFSAGGKRIFSDVGGIIPHGGFYDYESKYRRFDMATVTDRAHIDECLGRAVVEYSEALADAIGIRQLSRFDFLLSKDGRLVFNEINTFPGFTESSLYPRLMAGAGVSPYELINTLICEVLG